MATYDLKYPGAAIDAILDTAYDLQNAGYIFRGLASEYSNTPTERSWVLAGEGETGHGFTSPIPKGYIGVCVFNGTSWTGKLLKCVSIDSTPTSGSTNAISSGGAYDSITNLATFINNALDNLTFTDTTPSAFIGNYINMKVSTTAGGIERILTFFTILSATASKAGLLSAADKAKLDALWSSGYQFAGIATPSTTPISTTSKIFYIATEAGTYFNSVTVTQGINILSWNGTSWSAEQVAGIDDEPTARSSNLVKSGGVKTELALGAVYDVSAHNNGATFESLSALLSDTDLNALIPTAVRKGGMSIKFVQSSDNKYVQYRLMANQFSAIPSDWQGVDEEPTFGSANLVQSGGVKNNPWIRPENTNFMYRKNIFEGTWELGGLYTATANMGQEYSSDSICRTDYMNVKQGTDYVFLGFRNSSNRIYDAMYAFFYDSGKDCIGMANAYNSAVVHTPNNTSYIRIMTREGYFPGAASQDVIKMTMLEGTTAATEYSPSDLAYSDKMVLEQYDTKIENGDKDVYDNTLHLSGVINEVPERKGNYSAYVWQPSIGSHRIIPIASPTFVCLAANSNYAGSYAFIKDYNDKSITFCDGITDTSYLAKNGAIKITQIPFDAKYLYVRVKDTNEDDCSLSVIDIDGVNYAESAENKGLVHIKDIPFVCGEYSTGGIYTNNNTYNGVIGTWVRTKDVLFIKAGSYIIGTYRMEIRKYNSDSMNDCNSLVLNADVNGYVFKEDGYYTISMRKTDRTALYPETTALIATLYTDKDYNFIEAAFVGGTGYYAAGGDCTIFKTPHAKNIVIDGSSMPAMDGDVKRAFYYRGIERVDVVIVSHYHSDHTQGLCYAIATKILNCSNSVFYLPDEESMQYVIENMGVGERFYGDFGEQSYATYVFLKSYFEAEPDSEGNVTVTWNNIEYVLPQFKGTLIYPDHDGQTAIIDGLKIEFWNTDHSVYTTESFSGTYNDFSLCCDIVFGTNRICMTGDIGPVAEAQMQAKMKKSNILKAMHHGWENSIMNSDFICRVYPDIVVSEDSKEHDTDGLIYRETSPLQSWCEKNGIPNYRVRTNGVMDFVITDKSIEAVSIMKNFIRGGIDWGLAYGDTGNRPKARRPGMQYFDTTLGKPVYWNGSGWVDANGTSV